MAGLDHYETALLIDRKKERESCKGIVEKYGIRTPSLDQQVQYLSGGNQQKVVLAKWLSLSPKVLLLDEPTRGVDVGAKQEIYRLIEQLADQGVATLMISSEMQEILGMSDRILVMWNRGLAGELSRAEATEEAVMFLATGKEAA
jgi:ribose transport system ATP-binding protein